ncbi:hypothetical protein CR513_39163, partial [Mucuna pruriens]
MTRKRSIECGSSGNQNHGRSKSRRRKNLKCYNCGMREHLKKDCWHNKKNGGKNFEPSTSQGCVASTLDDGLILYSKVAITSKGGKQVHDKWIVDSGATWHMTPHRDWFHTYEPISGGSVFMGNNHALEIAGVDTLQEENVLVVASSQEKVAMMWHHRLSYMSKQGLKVLVEHNLLPRIKMIKKKTREDDSSEVEQEHEKQEPNEVNIEEARQTTH